MGAYALGLIPATVAIIFMYPFASTGVVDDKDDGHIISATCLFNVSSGV